METMQPRPSGAEAPDVLPAAPAAVSAEATGLGGTYSVTLIATATQEPVNSPQLGSAARNPASELGTFSTTPTASSAAASSYLDASAGQDISSCSGAATPVHLGATPADSCLTDQGAALTWAVGPWRVQVQTVGGSKAPAAAGTALASWLAGHRLPPASKGVVAVSVPGSAEAGNSTTSEVLWDEGHDVYETGGPGNGLEALDLAASMRPWPGG
ncbi:MAG: hypothetical protein ACRDZX_09195 [Acidimicrobiales bacterium]